MDRRINNIRNKKGRAVKGGKAIKEFNQISSQDIDVMLNQVGFKDVRGGFSKVYERKFKGNIVAIKICDNKKIYTVEKEMLMELQYKYIVEVVGCCDDRLALILPFMPHTLSDVLEDVDWTEAVKILIQLADGISHIHKKNIRFMDLKPQNVLLDKDRNVRICDFGVALRPGQIGEISTEGYAGPERPQGAEKSFDIYSFGIVMIQILMRSKTIHDGGKGPKKPGQPAAIKEMATKMHKTQKHIVHEYFMGKGCNKRTATKLSDLAMNCVNELPKLRPEIHQVVERLQEATTT